MRDRETIDSELRLLVAERRSIRERGGQPPSNRVDELLDERLGHRPEPAPVRCKTKTPRRRTRILPRFRPFAALPRPLMAIATVLVALAAVVMVFSVMHTRSPATPTAAPPPGEQSELTPPVAPATPKPSAAPLDIVDTALVEALRHDGVPVPSHEYVVKHAHTVCDLLAHQPNFADAVSSVQRTSIWDGDQSTKVVAGAIVSYCPEYTPESPHGTQQVLEDAASHLQRIQDDLNAIDDSLSDIRALNP